MLHRYLRALQGTTLPVTRELARQAVRTQAQGIYKLFSVFDDWQAYPAERLRFLRAIAQARNPIVYGGDDHAAFVGTLLLDEDDGDKPDNKQQAAGDVLNTTMLGKARPGRLVVPEFDGMAMTSPNPGTQISSGTPVRCDFGLCTAI